MEDLRANPEEREEVLRISKEHAGSFVKLPPVITAIWALLPGAKYSGQSPGSQFLDINDAEENGVSSGAVGFSWSSSVNEEDEIQRKLDTDEYYRICTGPLYSKTPSHIVVGDLFAASQKSRSKNLESTWSFHRALVEELIEECAQEALMMIQDSAKNWEQLNLVMTAISCGRRSEKVKNSIDVLRQLSDLVDSQRASYKQLVTESLSHRKEMVAFADQVRLSSNSISTAVAAIEKVQLTYTKHDNPAPKMPRSTTLPKSSVSFSTFQDYTTASEGDESTSDSDTTLKHHSAGFQGTPVALMEKAGTYYHDYFVIKMSADKILSVTCYDTAFDQYSCFKGINPRALTGLLNLDQSQVKALFVRDPNWMNPFFTDQTLETKSLLYERVIGFKLKVKQFQYHYIP